MKHKYQVILVIAALLLAAAVVAALLIMNNDPKSQKQQSSETSGSQVLSPEETAADQSGNESTLHSSGEAIATQGETSFETEKETTVELSVTFPDEPTPETEGELTIPQQNWTGGGIVLPDDDWEDE